MSAATLVVNDTEGSDNREENRRVVAGTAADCRDA